MRTLALDLATTTGWAADGPSGVVFGAIKFPQRPKIWDRCRYWLIDMIEEHDPEVVVRESPGHFKGVHAAAVAHGLTAITEMVVEGMDLPCLSVRPNQVRSALMNNGNATKPQIVAWAREQGFDVEDHNAADAIAVLTFARQKMVEVPG